MNQIEWKNIRVLALSLVTLVCLSVANALPAAANKSQSLAFGNYRALVIGINDYQHITKLETAINDATAMNDLLIRKYGFTTDLLLNPTRYEIVRALDKLRAELEPEDNLLIYYAGHGFLDRETEEGFWLPADAEEGSQANWVDISTISRTLRAVLAKHVLIIADSCFSGTLTRDAGVQLETGGDRLQELQRLSNKRARKALTSGGLEPVVDGGGDGHSVFTRALLRQLEESDKPLDSYALFSNLRRRVIINADQTPEYGDIRKSGDEGGEFIFVPKGTTVVLAPENGKVTIETGTATRAADPAGRVSDKAAIELAFWRSIENSQDPGDFQAYMQTFPNGQFAALAESRFAKLNRSNTPATSDNAATKEAVPYIVMSAGTLREKPSRNGATIAQLEIGTEISIIEKVDGRNYFLARYGGLTGYIYVKSVKPKSTVVSIEQRAQQERIQEQARKDAEKREQDAAYQRYLDAERRKQYDLRRNRWY